MSTKVLIFGTGGVGCIYAYILSKAGCEVTTVCRSNYDVVRERGIRIRSALLGSVEFRPHAVVRSVGEAEAEGPFDYVLVCSKAFPGTAELIKEGVTEGKTAIVLAQNGIGIEEEYSQLFPRNTVISGVVYLPTTQVELGVIEMGPLERFEIGVYESPSKTAGDGDGGGQAHNQALHLSDLFTAGGFTCPLFSPAELQSQRWIKLSINATWNPICALTRCDDANFLRSTGDSLLSEQLATRLMTCVSHIASAALQPLPSPITPEVIQNSLNRPRGRLETGGKEPSMLTDIRMGRGIEVEAILGNMLKIADQKKVGEEWLGELRLLYCLGRGLDFGVRRPEDEWKEIARH